MDEAEAGVIGTRLKENMVKRTWLEQVDSVPCTDRDRQNLQAAKPPPGPFNSIAAETESVSYSSKGCCRLKQHA